MTTLRKTLAEHLMRQAGLVPDFKGLTVVGQERWLGHAAEVEAVVLAWVGARLGEPDLLRRVEDAIELSEQFWAEMHTARMATDAAMHGLRDALGVSVAPNSASVGVDPTSTLAAEFDRSNDTDGICDPGCPLLGCPDCPIEASNRDHQEAK